MTIAAIEIQDASVQFGKRLAVRNLSLSISVGESLVLIGQSGAGKTTLLRAIAGLQSLTAGKVLLAGEPATALPPEKRSIGLVTQDYALYPQRTVLQNLELAARLFPGTNVERKQHIVEVLEKFSIKHLQKAFPHQLSGGEAQRTALAKALVRRPNVLLMDEPLSQIDPILRREVRSLISDVVRDFSVTLVMVTHDPLDAQLVGDRIAVLDQGEIVDLGTHDQLFRKPATTISAMLTSPIGINWLSAKHARSIGGIALSENERLGFRPESARLSDQEEAHDESLTHFEAQFLHDRPYMDRRIAVVERAGDRWLVVVPRDETCPQSGTQVIVTVPIDDLIVATDRPGTKESQPGD